MAQESLMQPRVGVGVFIFKDGRFLMGQRKGSHGSGSWSVPGGWLEYQESFEAASAREVMEETGLAIKNTRFAALTNNIFRDEQIHSLTVWMMADWANGEPIINEPDKFIDQKWVDFDTLPEPLFLPWEPLLKSDFLTEVRHQLELSKGA
jgi:8-oxo-dGTP diphosphatase